MLLGIEGAEITCGPDFIQVEVSTTKKLQVRSSPAIAVEGDRGLTASFQGRLFFEGFLLEPGCSSPEDSSREVPGKSRFDVQVKAAHGKCGLVKTYEVRPLNVRSRVSGGRVEKLRKTLRVQAHFLQYSAQCIEWQVHIVAELFDVLQCRHGLKQA